MAKRDDSVSGAVSRDLARVRRRDAEVAGSALAAAALVLAGELDDPGNSATSKSMCARALKETMDRLWELLPPVEEADRLDDLTSRRQTRLRRGAGT